MSDSYGVNRPYSFGKKGKLKKTASKVYAERVKHGYYNMTGMSSDRQFPVNHDVPPYVPYKQR